MTDLLRSEFIKTTTTRLVIWMGIATLLLSLLYLAIPLGLGLAVDEAAFNDPAFISSLFATTLSAAMFAMLLGIVAMTAEFRHNTIAPTFLATPKRERVLAAKAIVLAGIGAALGLAVYLVNVLVVLVVLATKVHASIPWATCFQSAGWTMLGFALFAAFGVTFGALLRGQATAIVVAVLWLLIAEGIVSVIRPEIGKWLPGQVLQGLGSDQSVISIAVLFAYIAAFGLAAALTTLRRDVT